MDSPINDKIEWAKPRSGCFAASLAAIFCFLRGLPLFFSRRPKTPLRVLCLMAFDTVHVLRKSRQMSSQTLLNLASLLDFAACANDFFDKNNFSLQEYRVTRRLLKHNQSSAAVKEYMSRLRHLEYQRPSLGGDDVQHRKAQIYRESVIRLSLGTITAMALDNLTIEDGIQATYSDEVIETLYQIVMLCQIIDDVFDYKNDSDNRLPSFLTAHDSLSRALSLTSDAATQYADQSRFRSSPHLFPFRVALFSVTALAKSAITLGYWRFRFYAFRNGSVCIKGRRV